MRTYSEWYIFSNSERRDVFYFNTQAIYRNFPEQLSVQSCISNSDLVMDCLLRINFLVLYDFPRKWIRRRVIHLFKTLVRLFGEDNLLHPTILAANNRICFSSYNSFNLMYEQFNEHYPESMPENTPFNEDSLQLHFLASREIHGGPPEYYALSSKTELEAELSTLDLQLAYVDIYCNDLTIYIDKHFEQSDSENYTLVKKVFLVYKQNKAVFSFATPYKSEPPIELTSK